MTNNGARIGLVTYSGLPHLDHSDKLLQAALIARNFDAEAVVWDDPGVDWSSFDLCVIRSTWDYHHRRAEFLEWAERVSALAALRNSAEIVRWNSHKSYLRDLHMRGAPIVPTKWFQRGDAVDLAQLMTTCGWQDVVIKPAVSASAHATILVSLTSEASFAEGQAHLDNLLATGDVLVQPYMASVESYRERSALFIRGELTHSVSKPPVLHSESKDSDYRLVMPSDDEVALARDILRLTDYDTLYARVDIVRDDAGNPCLLELELVEPSLFLDLSTLAVERLVEGIAADLR